MIDAAVSTPHFRLLHPRGARGCWRWCRWCCWRRWSPVSSGGDPRDALRGDGYPPVERLTFQRVELTGDGIVASVMNDGPDPVQIAQVQVDDAYWLFTADNGTELQHLGRTTLSIPYPWVHGEAARRPGSDVDRHDVRLRNRGRRSDAARRCADAGTVHADGHLRRRRAGGDRPAVVSTGVPNRAAAASIFSSR